MLLTSYRLEGVSPPYPPMQASSKLLIVDFENLKTIIGEGTFLKEVVCCWHCLDEISLSPVGLWHRLPYRHAHV